jgi:hypothetical protein
LKSIKVDLFSKAKLSSSGKFLFSKPKKQLSETALEAAAIRARRPRHIRLQLAGVVLRRGAFGTSEITFAFRMRSLARSMTAAMFFSATTATALS